MAPPFSVDAALQKRILFAKVHDVDHVSTGLLRVDTEYIIEVKITDASAPAAYMISKSYHQFRVLSKRFKEASEVATAEAKSTKDLSKAALYLLRLVEDFSKLIDSEPVEYFAKVSLQQVKKLSKERSRRIDDALMLITQTSTPPEESRNDKGVSQLLRDIENFFWSDHVVEEGAKLLVAGQESASTAVTEAFPSLPASPTSPIMERAPTSTKCRRSEFIRIQDLESMTKLENEKGALFLVEHDAEQKNGKKENKDKISTPLSSIMNSPVIKIVAAALAIYFLRLAKAIEVKTDGDYALFFGFVMFAMGFNVSRLESFGEDKNSQESAPAAPANARVKFSGSANQGRNSALALLRKSMASTSMNRKSLAASLQSDDLLELHEEEDDALSPRPLIQSPLERFPPNGDPETDLNCVSEPPCDLFHVRGPAYLMDRKKVASGEMLFPFRGADLLLTDECPEHVARNSALFGGRLREKPTFLVNFRLPWGVFVLYFELPELYLQFLQKAYEPDFSSSLPSLDNMSPSQRCISRFMLGDDDHKKETLKLIPHVSSGPWLVKNVVGSTPAIIGNKLPVTYTYAPADGDKCCYLEVDLDIVASAAARKILSVVRSYTQGLTIDLGFVCEGKQPDELPEQMFGACRIHGIDPLHASLLPPMPHDETNYDTDQ